MEEIISGEEEGSERECSSVGGTLIAHLCKVNCMRSFEYWCLMVESRIVNIFL